MPDTCCPISVARRTTGGENPPGFPQRPEEQRSSSTAWAHHYPKPDAPETGVRAEPEAIGTPHDPAAIEERAAPQHPACVLACFSVLTTVVRFIGILKICLLPVRSP